MALIFAIIIFLYQNSRKMLILVSVIKSEFLKLIDVHYIRSIIKL